MEAATIHPPGGPAGSPRAGAPVPIRPPSLGEIARFAAPLVMGLLTAALHSVVDTLFVGRLGTAPVAAVGIAATMYFVGVMLFIGVMRNSIAFVARAHGEGRPERVGPIVAQYQWIALAAAPAMQLAALVYPFVASLSRMSPDVEAMGAVYLTVRLWGVPLFLTVVLYSALFQAIGNSVLPMALAWGELALKSFLNYLLIFGHWGLPAMGLEGAAWATVCAEAVSVVAMLTLVHGSGMRARFHLRLLGPLEPKRLLRVLAVAIPQGMGDGIEVAAYLAFFAIVGRVSEATLAANNIAIVTTQLLFLPAFALGIAGASYMGRFLGARQPDLAEGTSIRLLVIGAVYMGFLGLPLWVFGVPIAGLYTADPQVIHLASLAFKVMALYQVCDGTGIILRLTLGGAGDTRVPTLIMTACAGMVLLPGAWLLSASIDPGIVGGWLAAFVHMTVLAALLWWRFRRGAWRSVHLDTAAA